MVMIEMSFSVPYYDHHESSSMMVGLFKMETGCSNSFYLDISFSINAFSSFYAY